MLYLVHIFPDIENDKFALPPWKTLMKYRVVVCSCLDAGILVAAHCTNTALMRLEQEITSSLHPHRYTKPNVPPHWSHLLIDEVCIIVRQSGGDTDVELLQAAQGSEPELLIPISVVFAQVALPEPVGHEVTQMAVPQLVLCGDPQQRVLTFSSNGVPI